ncbi:unnamed protein product [Closterium sp. Naga37s-1]|nr:unnamed protein product [Closterium sp. Naga37s-1]
MASDFAIAQFKYLERLLLVLALPPCPLPVLLPPSHPPATLPSPSPPWQAVMASDFAIAQFKYLERLLAVMASDFAIAQFKYLERLLLVHGHWSYKRIANAVTYFFYKNVAFGLTIFYYNAYAVFSGQIVYNSWACSLYNVFFTSLPVIGYGVLEQDLSDKQLLMVGGGHVGLCGGDLSDKQLLMVSAVCVVSCALYPCPLPVIGYGVLEQDLSDKQLLMCSPCPLPLIGYGVLEQDLSDKQLLMVSEWGLCGAAWGGVGLMTHALHFPPLPPACPPSPRQFPALYQQGPKNVFFHWTTIAMWIGYGVFQSVLLFWTCLAAVLPQASLPSGKLFEMNGLSATLMTGVVVAVNIQIALITEHWTWITHLFIWGSIAVWYFFLGVYSYFGPDWSTDYYYIFSEVLAPSALYWLTGLLLLPVMAVLPYFVFRGVESRIAPPDQQIVQEIVKLKQDEEAAKAAVAPPLAPVGFTAAVEAGIVRLKQDEEAAKAAVAPPLAPVGFTAAVAAVSKRLRKVEKKRRRRGEK